MIRNKIFNDLYKPDLEAVSGEAKKELKANV